MNLDAITSVTALVSAIAGLVGAVAGFLTGRKLPSKNIAPHLFVYSGGSFVKDGQIWREYDSNSNQKFLFQEIKVEDGFTILFDRSRNLLVRLPTRGGIAECSDFDRREWQGLYSVEPAASEPNK